MSLLTFQKGEIQVRTVDGPLDIIANVCDRGLAYHKALGKDGWSVTHIASGMSINFHDHAGFPSVEEAQEYILYALSLPVDWSSDLDWRTWYGKGPVPEYLVKFRQGWTAWWDQAYQGKKDKEWVSNPILDLFGT